MNQNSLFLSIVAPAYNEEENIECTVRDWFEVLSSLEFPGEVVIANDGSSDSTQGILERLQVEYSNLNVLCAAVNSGYGKAMSDAIHAARGEFVLTIDSDGQFKAEDVRFLLKEQQRADFDFVIGYRARKKDSLIRVVADRGLNLLVRFLFRVPFSDTNCAVKLAKRECIQRIQIESVGFSFPTEMTIKADQMGFRVAEVEVRHLERQGGKSKLDVLFTAWAMLKVLMYLRFKIHLKKKGLIQSL